MEQPPRPNGEEEPEGDVESRADADAPEHRVSIRTTADLLAAVPYLLGYHPEDGDMVVIGNRGPTRRLNFGLRVEVGADAAGLAEYLLDVLRRNKVDEVALIGYGASQQITPIIDSLRSAVEDADLAVYEALRVENQRYWSYQRDEDQDTAGTPIEDSASRISAEMVFGGATALASRSDLARSVEPAEPGVPGEVFGQVVAEWKALTKRSTRQAVEVGRQRVREAVRLAREDGRLDDSLVAWLAVTMSHLAVRDDAWAHMDPAHRDKHLVLWLDVMRRTPDELIAAPGSLLAFVAWQCGNGALANLALDRVGRADPDYALAHLVSSALQRGLPPSAAVLSMTPDEVAASYDKDL